MSSGGFQGPRPLSRLVPTIAGKALGKKGAAFGALVADWDSIMGPEMAAMAVPERLSFSAGRRDCAVLHLRACGAAALELQHAEPRIVERINAYFGFAAVERLRLVQGPVPRRRQPSVPRPPTAEQEAAMDRATAGVEDDALRTALKQLGLAMAEDVACASPLAAGRRQR
ncbi:MAG: DciA family protein [Azospirillaceae bacterium]|nr:DciA family protein [Azospirillaceae bacterium]